MGNARRSRVRLLTPYRRHAWWPVGQNERVAGDNIDSVTLSDADRVSLWLMSTDGRNAVQRTLRALRLPGFFDTDLDFVVRGLGFIAIGAGFLYMNVRAVRQRKKHAQ